MSPLESPRAAPTAHDAHASGVITEPVAAEQELGLRQRKKQQTRAAIARAALDLFDRQGFGATTIPEIAGVVDVSPRTVSSYFPAKEDLAFPDTAESFARLEARLSARVAGETTAEALRDWIASESETWAKDADRHLVQRRVIAAEPALQAYSKRFLAEGERLVAAGIAEDLGGSPSDLEARMASAATLAILGVIENRDSCAKDESDALIGGKEEALALLDRALLFVSAGIRALQIARAEDAAV